MLANQTITDHDLVSRLKEGDQSAFNEIYNKYWTPLFRTAYNILQEEDGTSDALQEVFIRLWHRRGDVEIESLKSYLHQSVRFTVLKAIRNQKTDQKFYKRLAETTTEIIAENPLLFKEQEHLIHNLIDQLPDDCRRIFKLSREENMTYKQIAELLNISQKTVEKKMSRSLKIIRGGLSVELCLVIMIWYYMN